MHRINPLVKLHWRQFDDDWVVFESLSGQTHQMVPMSAAILMSFESGLPLSIPALITTLETDFNFAVDEFQAPAIALVVGQLVALGIVVTMTDHAPR